MQPLRNLQVNLALPFVETYRAASGLTEAGGGVGDLSFGARYDFLYADNPHRLPGFALLAAMTAPTGTPVELAHKPMATDATGQGMWQGAVGGTLDYEATPNLLLELFGQVAFRARRQVGGVSEQLAPQGLIAAAAAYVFEGLQVLALTASVQLEGDAWINGERVSGSARRVTSLGIFGAWPLPAGFTVQATLAGDLPISAFGQGQPAGLGVTVAVIKRW